MLHNYINTSLYGEGLQHPTIPMTPDRSVTWQQVEIPSMQGTLYHSADVPEGLPQKVLAVAGNQSNAFADPRILDMNEWRAVVADKGLIYKVAYLHARDEIMGLSAVRASVALHEGLQRISQPAVDSSSADPHYYAAPRMYALFAPEERTYNRQVMVMSHESGNVPSAENIPSTHERQAHYAAAVGACGLSSSLICFDDLRQNLLVGQDEQAQKLRIVKIDTIANTNYAQTSLYK
jgi:hypothetical protein